MISDFSKLSAKDIYFTLIQTIIPRPIAWVLSDNGEYFADTGNRWNVAPFSFFNGVTSKPPIISISVGRKRDGSRKDTWTNIEERSHFVVHIPGVTLAQAVANSAAPMDHGESEALAGNLELVEIPGFPLPRLKDAAVAFACERYQIVAIGDTPQGLILGEIKAAWIEDTLCEGTLEDSPDVPRVNAARLDPLARLGGQDYSSLGDILTVPAIH